MNMHIERFVVLKYSKTCASSSVNDARYNYFFTSSQSLENIPPTQAEISSPLRDLYRKTVLSESKEPSANRYYLTLVLDDHSKICLSFWTTLAD